MGAARLERKAYAANRPVGHICTGPAEALEKRHRPPTG